VWFKSSAYADNVSTTVRETPTVHYSQKIGPPWNRGFWNAGHWIQVVWPRLCLGNLRPHHHTKKLDIEGWKDSQGGHLLSAVYGTTTTDLGNDDNRPLESANIRGLKNSCEEIWRLSSGKGSGPKSATEKSINPQTPTANMNSDFGSLDHQMW